MKDRIIRDHLMNLNGEVWLMFSGWKYQHFAWVQPHFIRIGDFMHAQSSVYKRPYGLN